MKPGGIKRTIRDWLLVLAFLLDEIAAAVVLLVILWALDVEISTPVIVGIVLALGVFIFITHKAIIPAFRRKKATGSESMIGTECEVVEDLEPCGVVRMNCEYWKATSVEGNISTGELVRIVRVNRLSVEVRRSGDGDNA